MNEHLLELLNLVFGLSFSVIGRRKKGQGYFKEKTNTVLQRFSTKIGYHKLITKLECIHYLQQNSKISV